MNTLLVIDDDLPICTYFTKYFANKDYKVFSATTGEEGLAIVKERKPDLIFLDIIMDGRSGIYLLQEIKKIDDKAKVIMLTALKDQKIIAECKKGGAIDYITKPFNLEELEKDIIPRALKSKQRDNL